MTMKRSYGLIALGLAAALAVLGCSDDSGPTGKPQPPARAGLYVGATVCKDCHEGVYQQWLTTAHSRALPTLARIGQDHNPICLRCHTTGFGAQDSAGHPLGFVSQEATPHLINVQCEDCHGPGGEHVSAPSKANIQVTLDAELCGRCHNDPHHPTIEDWRESKHAEALETLHSRPYARDECVICHSADARLAQDAVPTLRSAAQFPVTCAACHDPHQATEHGSQLRKALSGLCIQCHTTGDTLPGNTPHHSQGEMLEGRGGFAADGFPQLGPNSAHATAVEKTCVQCHVHRENVPDPTTANPVVTGHTFRANLKGCAPCHDVAGAQALKGRVQRQIQAHLEELQDYFTSGNPKYIDPDTLTGAQGKRYHIARFNYDFVVADKSRGVHNTAYAAKLLEIARDILIELSGTAGRVEGTVRDANTGAFLAGALVEIEGGPSTATDAAGQYRFAMPAGTYRITASQAGYESQTASVTVSAGGTARQDFALPPVAQPVSFARDVQPLFRRSCTACHNASAPSGGLNLSSGAAYGELVNVPSQTDAQVPPRLRVARSNSADSYLYVRIRDQHPFAAALSAAEERTIQRWIDEGAQNN